MERLRQVEAPLVDLLLRLLLGVVRVVEKPPVRDSLDEVIEAHRLGVVDEQHLVRGERFDVANVSQHPCVFAVEPPGEP